MTARVTHVFKSFNESRAFVQTLDLKSYSEWREYCKSDGKPDDIPKNPQVVYHNKGWISWGDWLGTGHI